MHKTPVSLTIGLDERARAVGIAGVGHGPRAWLRMQNRGSEVVHIDPRAIEVVHETPSDEMARWPAARYGPEARQPELVVPAGGRIDDGLTLADALDAPGCHRFHVEIPIGPERAVSNTVVREVELGNYVEGAARVVSHTDPGIRSIISIVDEATVSRFSDESFYAVGVHQGSDGSTAIVEAYDNDPPEWRGGRGASVSVVASEVRELSMSEGSSELFWLAGREIVHGDERFSVAGWPLRILASRNYQALALAGPALTAAARELLLVDFRTTLGGHGRGVLWAAPLPGDIGSVRAGVATLYTRHYNAPRVALLGETEAGVVLAVALLDDAAPPVAFRKTLLAGYEAHPDAPPALHSIAGMSTVVGALVRQRGAPTAAWDLVSWYVAEDLVDTLRIVPPSEPRSARLVFRADPWDPVPAPPLAAVLLGASGEVTVWPGGAKRATLRAHEPLRITGNASGLYLLRLDPEYGPSLTPLGRR
ncbi:MAG: hypothetical protein HY908_02760 [Myxococcales bacterium]|nr:hypothetical protein [Myxococcales bacterium]